MKKDTLVEIKRGEVGTGLLIENDGFIAPDFKDNKKLFEDINGERGNEDFYCPYPLVVSAVLQKFGIENANGRIYPESVLKREAEKYIEKIREKRALGEANHPDDQVIDLSRVAINVIEMHWEGHTLVGKLEIITSPGFRKYGMITCQGDQIANLVLQGIKIGVSSRGVGTVTNKMGVMYVSDDYEIICWDVVSDPSTPNAWITPKDEIPQQYIESKEVKDKNPLNEKLDKFKEWLVD